MWKRVFEKYSTYEDVAGILVENNIKFEGGIENDKYTIDVEKPNQNQIKILNEMLFKQVKNDREN